MGIVTRLCPLLLVALSVTGLDQEVAIRARLTPGQEFRLDVSHARENTSSPVANFTARSQVVVKVLKAGPEGSLIEWRYGTSTVDGPGAKRDPTLAFSGRILGDVVIRIALDTDGSFLRLDNEAELVPRFQALIDALVTEVSRTTPAPDAERLKDLIRQLLAPPVLVQLITRDAQMYGAMYGVSLPVGQGIEAKINQPNPLGGPPLPAIFKVRLVEATEKTATLESTTTFDADSVTRMTTSLLERAGGQAIPEELAKARLEITDDAKAVFDRAAGLISEVIVTRGVSFAGQRRTDRWVIRLAR